MGCIESTIVDKYETPKYTIESLDGQKFNWRWLNNRTLKITYPNMIISGIFLENVFLKGEIQVKNKPNITIDMDYYRCIILMKQTYIGVLKYKNKSYTCFCIENSIENYIPNIHSMVDENGKFYSFNRWEKQLLIEVLKTQEELEFLACSLGLIVGDSGKYEISKFSTVPNGEPFSYSTVVKHYTRREMFVLSQFRDAINKVLNNPY